MKERRKKGEKTGEERITKHLWVGNKRDVPSDYISEVRCLTAFIFSYINLHLGRFSTVTTPFFFFFFFFNFMARTAVYGNSQDSWARDWIWATAVTHTATVAKPDPSALCAGPGINSTPLQWLSYYSQILNPLHHGGNFNHILFLQLEKYSHFQKYYKGYWKFIMLHPYWYKKRLTSENIFRQGLS